jgi:hypothetical protein
MLYPNVLRGGKIRTWFVYFWLVTLAQKFVSPSREPASSLEASKGFLGSASIS